MKKQIMMASVAALLLAGCSNEEKPTNPLFSEYSTPYEIPPFSEITVDHLREAILKGIEEEKQELQEITENAEAPTFENTILRLDNMGALLRKAQNKLFNIGGYLANDKADALYGVKQEDVEELERFMDQMNEELPPAQGFVLPGGTRLSAQADRCRTVTRRAERRVVTLAKVATIDPLVLEYINRLSDFFFVFARYNNIQNQVEEIYWDKNA